MVMLKMLRIPKHRSPSGMGLQGRIGPGNPPSAHPWSARARTSLRTGLGDLETGRIFLLGGHRWSRVNDDNNGCFYVGHATCGEHTPNESDFSIGKWQELMTVIWRCLTPWPSMARSPSPFQPLKWIPTSCLPLGSELVT